MTPAQPTEPFEIPSTISSNRGSGIVFTTLGIGVVVLYGMYCAGQFELPRDMHDFPVGLVCGIFALMLFWMGIPEFFRRHVYRVDPLHRSLREARTGMCGTRYGDEIPFDQLEYVRISLYTGPSSTQKSRHYYPVTIHLKSAESKRIFISDFYQKARARGEQLAKAANVDLHDDSQPGETQIRAPEQLDQTVREKLGKEFFHRTAPGAPAKMHAAIKPGMEKLVIEIPRFNMASLGKLQRVLWIIWMVFGAWTAIALYFHEYMFALFGALVCGTFFFLVFRSETVIVSRDALTVRAGLFFIQVPRSIPLSELEELTLLNATKEESKESDQLLGSGQISRDIYAGIQAITALGSAIVARSDRRSFSFGRVLSAAELDYILYEIEQRIRN